jgi:hypothetical protein
VSWLHPLRYLHGGPEGAAERRIRPSLGVGLLL